MVIYNKLKGWFTRDSGFQDSSDEHHLDVLDRLVRTDFAQVVKRTAGGSQIRYSHALLPALPALWHALDYISDTDDMEMMSRLFVEHVSMALFMFPIFIKF